MASTISSLLVALGLDISDFKKGLADAEGDARSGGANIASGFSNIGGMAVAGIATVGVAAVGFVASTIGPASDLNETMSKTNVVFGDSAKSVQAFGDTAANSLGMSKNAALTAAGTYGNLFRSMGMTTDTSADMSTHLVTLAGDLASFNNMDPTEVMDSLRSGLSGMTEPLKRLGVNINEATLKQKALQMGLWDGKGTMDAAAKAQATYALIMEQTTLAQGDFGRTSDGVANQQRIMAANFEDLKGKIGSGLLPMMSALSTTLLKLFNSPEFQAGLATVTQGIADFAAWVVTNIPVAIAGFESLVAWFRANPGVIVAALGVIGVAIATFAVTSAISLWAVVAPLLPLIAVIALIGAGIYLLYEAWTNDWGGIQEKTAAVASFIHDGIAGLMLFITDLTTGKLGVVSEVWKTTWDTISLVFNTWWSNIQLMFKAFGDLFSGNWQAFGEDLRGIWDNNWRMMVGLISGGVENVKNILGGLISSIWDMFTHADWGEIGRNIIGGIADGISFATQWLIDANLNTLQAVLDTIKGFLGISSPSKVMKMQIGYQMGLGVMEGWQQSMSQMTDSVPGTMGGVVSAASVRGQVSGGLGGGIVVQYIDQAVVSSAREYEVAEKLGPALVLKLRQLGVL